MNVVGYGIWKSVHKELYRKYNSLNKYVNYSSYNQINKHYLQGTLSKEDKIVFLGMSQGDYDLQKKLHSEGYDLFPNPSTSIAIRERSRYLPELSSRYSKYSLKRAYLDHYDKVEILNTIKSYFDGKKVVMKVGDFHASEAKYLIDLNNYEEPKLKYKLRKLPIVLEEFIEDARSIRIGYIGNSLNKDNYFITEQINSKTWLKNNNPEEEITKSIYKMDKFEIDFLPELIDLVKEIGTELESDLLGVDFCITENKAYLLELNDIIGIPEGDFSKELFTKNIENLFI